MWLGSPAGILQCYHCVEMCRGRNIASHRQAPKTLSVRATILEVGPLKYTRDKDEPWKECKGVEEKWRRLGMKS